ncbi:MAG: hypothetical protein WCO84_04860 [bacterium]
MKIKSLEKLEVLIIIWTIFVWVIVFYSYQKMQGALTVQVQEVVTKEFAKNNIQKPTLTERDKFGILLRLDKVKTNITAFTADQKVSLLRILSEQKFGQLSAPVAK